MHIMLLLLILKNISLNDLCYNNDENNMEDIL